MSGIDGEADRPGDLFIGAGIAKGFPAENHFAFLDVETRHHIVPLAIGRLAYYARLHQDPQTGEVRRAVPRAGSGTPVRRT
jgi:hypothetical protein